MPEISATGTPIAIAEARPEAISCSLPPAKRPLLQTLQQGVLVWTAFATMISVSGFSIGMVLFLLLWFLSGDYAKKLYAMRRNNIALWSVGLFSILALGTLYSVGEWSYRLFIFQKYLKLLLIPTVMTTVSDERWRWRIYWAFLLSLIVTLVFSYLELLGVMPLPSGKFVGQGYVVYRSRITHGLLMAYAVYLFVQHCIQDERRRWLWVLAALFGAYNVLFMVGGRSGQLVLLILAIGLGLQLQIKWHKGALLGTLLSLTLVMSALSFSPMFKHRAQLAINEFLGYTSQQRPDVTHSSIGQRLQFYANTLALIKENPVFGSGTGSFSKLYAERAQSEGLTLATSNPHNEYLLLLQQIGLPGVVCFTMLGWTVWRESRKLDSVFGHAARGLVVVMAVGCFFNSLLMDITEGGSFCLLTGVFFAPLIWTADDSTVTQHG